MLALLHHVVGHDPSNRARLLAPQIAARLEAGWTAWLVTLTLRHERGDLLAPLFDGLGKGWSLLTSGKPGQALRARGRPEFVRGFDLTWSERHGWHPHVHVLLMLPPGHGDGQETADAFAARWRTVVAGLGFQALPAAQDVQRCADAKAAAAYATTPAAVYESVGISTKTARSSRAGLTAFDLLRAAVPEHGQAEPAAVARWCEYLAAVRGRRQTTVSRGMSLDEDQLLLRGEDVEMPPSDKVAEMGAETIAELDRTRRTAELLEAVEEARDDRWMRRTLAHALLSELRSRDWIVFDPVSVYDDTEPPPLPPPRPAFVSSIPLATSFGFSPPPSRVPPPGWTSPVDPSGRVSRPMTPEDRAVLCRMGATAG